MALNNQIVGNKALQPKKTISLVIDSDHEPDINFLKNEIVTWLNDSKYEWDEYPWSNHPEGNWSVTVKQGQKVLDTIKAEPSEWVVSVEFNVSARTEDEATRLVDKLIKADTDELKANVSNWDFTDTYRS